MKVVPVKDVKMYEAYNGKRFDKKREAEQINIHSARVEALRILIATHGSFNNLPDKIEEVINFIATFGDEVIEALTEEPSK